MSKPERRKPLVITPFRLDSEVVDAVDRLSSDLGITRSEWVRTAIDERLARSA